MMTRRAHQAGWQATEIPSASAIVEEKVYTLKFVLAGSSGVGKTQLASRIIRGELIENSIPTVGMEFGTRALRYANHSSVRAQLWDVAGKVLFKSVTEAFYRGAVGAMLVYDISRRSTFDELPRWLERIRQHCHKSIGVLMVGNKSDMSSKQREVSMVEGMRFARKHGLDFMETSALDDTNVEEASRQMVMSVARYLPQEKSVWPKRESSCPLPKGWVRVVDDIEDVRDGGNQAKKARKPMTYGRHVRTGKSVGDASNLIGKSVGDRGGNDGNETDDTDDCPTEHATNPSFDDEAIMTNGVNMSDIHGKNRIRSLSNTNVSNFTGSFVNYDESDALADVHGHRHGINRVPEVWYENIWTGQRVRRRPLYPAGPSDTCVVSHVPRPPDPLSFTTDTDKGGADGAVARGDQLKLWRSTSSWSFSNLKRKSCAAAADCLTKCVDTTE